MIDVIIPVYKGLLETQDCLRSVWRSSCEEQFRLIVINDYSPDPELTHWLRAQSNVFPMILLENSENLGFVATVNRGMQMSEDNDVLLLNSDTEVAAGWLDRIFQAAYAATNIATVTPFSNNATICSYPEFCKDNRLPDGFTVDSLDQVCAEANPDVIIDIPTAVGFCMFIRREALAKVGLFDVARFGAGYGEENDFCCRAAKLGFRNVLAPNVFVWHKGSVSFGDSHNDRKTKCLEVLQELHPTYIGDVHRHIREDPAREARLRADILRWRKRALPRILFITHDRGGGTEQHCVELAQTLSGKAHVFRLGAVPGGLTAITSYDSAEPATFHFALPEEYLKLVDLLACIGISRVHFHHTIQVDNSVWDLPRDLGVPQDYTAHDYYAMCPQITLTDENNRYCGELGESQCKRCLKNRPPVGNESITAWRGRYGQLLRRSDRVIVPVPSVGERYRRYFSLKNLVVAEHPDALAGWSPTVSPVAAPAGRDIRVAIVGALSPMKGADVVEEAVLDARNRSLPITFKLFGYAYRSLAEGEKFVVHGSYPPADLPSLLTAWKPDIVWFPALWPETYSYTLSECFRLGLPVLVSDLGALADRIKTRPHSWSFPWALSGGKWNDKIIEINTLPDSKTEACNLHADSANFYPDSYVPQRSSEVDKPIALLEPGLLEGTRYKELSSRQRSRLKVLEVLMSLRGHWALSWLTKRVSMTVQRRIKDRLLRR